MGVIFSLYNPFHPGIVEQVVSRLITRSPVAVMFLCLLRKITVDRPHLTTEIVPRLKEALEYACYLPPDDAFCLVSAVAPLCTTRPDLRDFTVMVRLLTHQWCLLPLETSRSWYVS